MKLLIAAGGTGGHIFPGISVAEAFDADKADEVLFAGTPYGLEERLIPPAGYRLVKIEARPFLGQERRREGGDARRRPQGRAPVPAGSSRAEKPDAILGMGGFTSVPVVLAGLLLRVPCFIHEQNVSPGMANRLLSGRVKATFVSFAETARYLKARKVVHTGNPIRKSMRGKRQEKGASAFTIFVFGGSRGARSDQRRRSSTCSPISKTAGRRALYHQTGADDFDRVAAGYAASSTDPRGLSLYGPDGEVLQPRGRRHIEGGGLDHLRAVILQEARRLRALSLCGGRPPVEERRLRRRP